MSSGRGTSGGWVAVLGRGSVALVGGLVAGLTVTLALLAYRAAVENVYMHYWGEIVGWLGLPVFVAPVILVWWALRKPARRFWGAMGLVLAAALLGTGAGALVGEVAGSHPSDPWSGGLMGAGTATVLALVAMLAGSLGAAPLRWLGLVVILFAGSCDPVREAAPTEAKLEPLPDSSEVRAVVFLLGDPGLARVDSHPVIRKMRQDVEDWSRVLLRGGETPRGSGSPPAGDARMLDSPVAMVVLGDVIYPDGLNALSGPQGDVDSARVAAQISIVSGPAADSVGARALFLPGNHDWGQEEDWAGAVRLVRLQDFLQGWQGTASGRLSLEPAPGTGGPAVVDVADGLRLILLDTAWWLLGAEPGEKQRVVQGVRSALESAGDRKVVMAAHHPLETGGPHGAGVDLGTFLRVRLLLKRAGILLQDLDSRPYTELKAELIEAFREIRLPDVFAGGHEHSLQVFSGDAQVGGHRGLVVGSAAKLTGVSGIPGMLFGRSEPGYGKIYLLADGSLHIELEAAPERFLACGPEASPDCMEEALAAYRTVWSEPVPRQLPESRSSVTERGP